HDVHLVAELPEALGGDVTLEAHPDLGPGGPRGEHGHAAIHERAARQIPKIVVVVDIEATERNQHHAGTKAQPAGQRELHPGLLEGDLGLVTPFDRLRKAAHAAFDRLASLDFQLRQTLELDLDDAPQALGD